MIQRTPVRCRLETTIDDGDPAFQSERTDFPGLTTAAATIVSENDVSRAASAGTTGSCASDDGLRIGKSIAR